MLVRIDEPSRVRRGELLHLHAVCADELLARVNLGEILFSCGRVEVGREFGEGDVALGRAAFEHAHRVGHRRERDI